MVDTIAHARVTDIIYAQLSPDGDLYNEIMEIARRENIKTGFILNIVGGLRKARLSMPVEATVTDAPPGVREFEGLMECSGVGTIGQTLETYDSEGTSGILYKAGDPNLHIHMTITVAGETYMGHLIEGCLVRSLHPKSHFTIVLAKTEGATLNFKVSRETTERYPRGIPIHELVQD
ncbi:PPC domain-containing DNA-binding protein [Microvirga antarctica]|uniref:PPC domain-containing DNA-binding protein n=1 Tax=Microvirga antarctica TaxID=2819233 RepID=UPI001B301FF7|nr:PPC domain-containing DNA-binding protein [Microvirga antarctica]